MLLCRRKNRNFSPGGDQWLEHHDAEGASILFKRLIQLHPWEGFEETDRQTDRHKYIHANEIEMSFDRVAHCIEKAQESKASVRSDIGFSVKEIRSDGSLAVSRCLNVQLNTEEQATFTLFVLKIQQSFHPKILLFLSLSITLIIQ
jgi:hypothetical protein